MGDHLADSLRWAILGTGAIARTFAAGVAASRTGTLVAVASRDQATADDFGERFGAASRYAAYEAALADPEVDAVYIATPHPFHAEWAIRAAEAGKHILVEKPMGINAAEAMAVVEAARLHDVFLMEGYMYRCHPQTARLVELIRDGAIGAVRMVEASFGFRIGHDPAHRLLDNALAGGGILDVGGYPVSMARLIAGAASGANVVDPIEVHAAGQLGAESRVDEWAAATLRFPGDLVAQVSTGVRVGMENVVRIFGDEGSIVIPAPWTLRGSPLATEIIVRRSDEPEPRSVVVEAEADPWAIEADTVARHLAARQATSPAMSWDDSLGNIRTTDRWREAIGLTYDAERLDAPVMRLPARPLAVRPDRTMTYGEIAGVGKSMSRLVMGVDNQTTMPHTAVMFDDFFERGGTCFDTAYIYGGGKCERVLGRWVEDRGLRDQVVILGKGAHTPHCTPEAVGPQLAESLDRLRTDHVDVYMLHRDDPAVPVGEFVDALNEQRAAGRARVFGVSNWSIERVEAANAYAAEHGMAGVSAISNNFSLARMVEPVWAGCVSSNDAPWRAWLARTRTPLMPWSSQARGFFTGRAAPEDHSDPELVRAWYADDNFERLARAREMASERSIPPIVIALAWVLTQPFPTFPLIGPHALPETRTSMAALEVTLTPEEVDWLNLEALGSDLRKTSCASS